MSELILQLPETLQHQLETLAEHEGVPLQSYILYTLTRQVSVAYTIEVHHPEAIAQQRRNFALYLEKLGKAPDAEVERILAERPVVEPEPDLRPETIARLKHLIAEQRTSVA